MLFYYTNYNICCRTAQFPRFDPSPSPSDLPFVSYFTAPLLSLPLAHHYVCHGSCCWFRCAYKLPFGVNRWWHCFHGPLGWSTLANARIHLKWLAVTASTVPANELWSISIIASIVEMLNKVSLGSMEVFVSVCVCVYISLAFEFAFRVWTHLFHRICIYLVDFRRCRSPAFHLCTFFATKIVYVCACAETLLASRQIFVRSKCISLPLRARINSPFSPYWLIASFCDYNLLFGRLFISPCIASPLFS